MKKPVLLCLLILTIGLFTACSNSAKETSSETDATTEQPSEEPQESPEPTISETPETPTEAELPADFLAKNEFKHPFSNPDEEDTFLLMATGETMTGASIVFTITNAEGNVIYREEFEGYSLMDYGWDETTGQSRDEYAKGRFDDFFKEDLFSDPAIKPGEEMDEFAIKTAWEEIKDNPEAIGFYYRLGAEDGRNIAYSKKQGKGVMFYNCC